jgi:YggT family protein
MRVLLQLLDFALAIYIWLLLGVLVLYWLIEFGAVDQRRSAVAVIRGWLLYVTAPALRPIRVIVPKFGGVDVSPVLAVLAFMAVRYVLALYVMPRVP